MNKLRVFENDNEYIEFSAESAEILVCRHILRSQNDDNAAFILNNADPMWFRTEERKDLFKIAKKYWEVRETIPSDEMWKQFFKNKKYSEKEDKLLKEYNDILNFKEDELDHVMVNNAIKEYIRTKATYFAIFNNIEKLETTGDISDLLPQLEKILQLDISEDLGIEYFENLDNHIADLTKPNEKVPFMFTELDKRTYGGLPAKDTCLFIILAQPGLGKSQFMMNVAYNWIMNNKKVLMLTLEMSEYMYSRRMDALFADVDVNKLRENASVIQSRVKGVKARIPNALLHIKEFPTGTLSSGMLKQYIKKLKQQKNFVPDIIFVDYLNIMRSNSNNASQSMYEKCARIAEDLRAISSEMKIPIVTATQSNRSGTTGGYPGENIDMSNVSESSGISATCDAMIALYRQEGDRENGILNVKILKNRLGRGVDERFKLYMDNTTLKISDWGMESTINDDVLGSVEATSVETKKLPKNDNDESHNSEIEEI